jgi:hypothetical protein
MIWESPGDDLLADIDPARWWDDSDYGNRSYGSRFWIEVWGYPELGVYFGDCPSAGHDMIAMTTAMSAPQASRGSCTSTRSETTA